jgi:hypothetical protein
VAYLIWEALITNDSLSHFIAACYYNWFQAVSNLQKREVKMRGFLLLMALVMCAGCGECVMSQLTPKSIPAEDQDRWDRCKGIVRQRQCRDSLRTHVCMDRIYSPYMDMSTEQRKTYLLRRGCPPYMVN